MPKPGPNSTYHKIIDKWDFTQYSFSPTVIVAEKRLNWYDEERFMELQTDLKKYEKVRFIWQEASETSHTYTKKKCRVELYKKFPEDTTFNDKIRDMEEVIKRYGL